MSRPLTEDTGTVWVATMDTQHFRFAAVGESDAAAFEALKRGWRQHAARHPGAIVDPDVALEDYGASVLEMTIGQAYRDGRPVGRGAGEVA